MNRSSNNESFVTNRNTMLSIFFAITMTSTTFNSLNAYAASQGPPDYRVAVAGNRYSDTWQFAVAFKFRPPRRLRARHIETAVGVLSTSRENRPFVSLGPVWRWSTIRENLFVDIGFSPTLIGRSTFNGHDLGGNFHFTSAAAFGAKLGRRGALTVSLRIQHTSNAGLSRTNPGLDMIGLNFSFNSPDR